MVYLEDTTAHFFYRQLLVTPKAPPSTTNLNGQTAIVSGSNTGLGLEAARQLLDLGISHLILAVRDETKGQAAKAQLSQTTKNKSSTIEVWHLDMASYDSVQSFAKQCSTLPRIDYVILNAGVQNFEYKTSSYNNELTVQVNYLSTCLLTILLLPILAKLDNNTHLTVVGSDTAEMAAFKEQKEENILSALNSPNKFAGFEKYATTKLVLLLFIRELVKHYKFPPNNKIILNVVNPGLCAGSELQRHASGIVATLVGGMKGALGRTTEVGARTYIDAAVVKGPESHGMFVGDNVVKP